MEPTVHLEGFCESLRGHRVYYVSPIANAKSFIQNRLSTLNTEVAHRGRKVLVFQGPAPPPKWLVQNGWDAVFHAREIQDLKLAVTYIQHAVRPTRIVWAGGEPASSILELLSRMDITLICVGDRPPNVQKPNSDWQAIFWSSDSSQEEVEPTLVAKIGASGVTGLRSILKEVRGSQVGLVWSSIGEDKKGALYWYDPSEGGEKEQIDLVEAANVLTELATFLRK